MKLFLAVTAAGLAVASAATQQVPTRTLAKPDVEYAEPFSGLIALLELRNGRVLAVDNRDKTFQIIDLTSGTAARIGREGSGPTEWGRLGRLLRMPGDTTYAYDVLNSRFLLVAPDGKPVRTFSPYAEAATQRDAPAGGAGTAGATAGARSGGGDARGAGGRAMAFGGVTSASVLNATHTDALGRMYYPGFPIVASGRGQVATDTFPIIRQAPAATRADTISFLRNPKDASEISGGGGRVSFRINAARPFESADAWVVFPDGRVVIVRVADYHLDVIAPDGRVTRGAPVRYTPVRVTEADKQQWRDARVGATMTTATGQTIPLSTFPGPDSWPDAKSPFAANAVFAAPNGDTWVFRQRAAADRVPVADVFDERGALIGRVALAADVRPLALGTRGLYAIRTDGDGVQYLQRYAVAWGSCTPDLAENCRQTPAGR